MLPGAPDPLLLKLLRSLVSEQVLSERWICVEVLHHRGGALALSSLIKTRGEEPMAIATAELRIHNLACRGNANLLMYYLDRDDALEIPGHLKLGAWPEPDAARARITHDSSLCNEAAIRRAITEPYYDPLGAEEDDTMP